MPVIKQRKFRVLAGTHVHDGKVFRVGEVVESPHDLMATFRNKFEEVHPATEANKGARVPPLTRADEKEADKVLKVDDAEGDEEKSEKDEKPATKGEQEVPEGLDVTKRFDKAQEEDFQVYKLKGKYFVYNADDTSVCLNPDGCAKSEVDDVITKALK